MIRLVKLGEFYGCIQLHHRICNIFIKRMVNGVQLTISSVVYYALKEKFYSSLKVDLQNTKTKIQYFVFFSTKPL